MCLQIELLQVQILQAVFSINRALSCRRNSYIQYAEGYHCAEDINAKESNIFLCAINLITHNFDH